MNDQITLDHAVEKIEHWRSKRISQRGRIPNSIWQSAIMLTQKHSVNIVARKMNLKISDLQSKIVDIKKPLNHNKTQLKSKKQSRESQESFVEISQIMPAASRCILELELSGGATVRIFQ